MSDEENKFPGENNTGHFWDDDLRELDNEPPTWWTIGFHASWIFVIVYTLLYPSWPMIDTHFKGLLGWTSIAEYKEDLKSIESVRAPYENKIKDMSAADILADDNLSKYVTASGKVLFGDNCSACHGAGGQGNVGFPVLADDDWLYGGTITDIETSINVGRQGIMPGHAAMLDDEKIDALSTSIFEGKAVENASYTEAGCIGCHGADGKGLSFMGSANLVDGIYRFTAADQLSSIKHTIKYGVNNPADSQSRIAVMPAFGGAKLSDTEIKKLAVYVHKLGGGQ
ncbi:MAG: cytochrome-c oxidase, cbb3-type subunit III [endosymbiont of Galathealinum brachiosum]|uniref:Cbb3-type cytochrome c oxidase subunit n=1 Tax=endosymbiont of Galathealinum brachiosum TaxID=2200906 RepID=A0A370DNA9_9GAMM|nr:MAG: cytochrome-c oxidase, cbb3-type subunit III [endosymbiont of Galathealinum brachiosum]